MDVYQRLAEFMDQLPGGFPQTDSGVELRLLRRLFSQEDAQLAMHLTLIAENARVIARRAGIPAAEAEERLESMVKRGLIVSFYHKDRPTEYMATQFVVGFYELQAGSLDVEVARDAEDVLQLSRPENWRRAPQMRTVPVGESIPTELAVISYEQGEQLVAAHDRFRVIPCICREKAHLLGEGCDKPLETCLMMGAFAEIFEMRDVGRALDRAGALEILQQANEAGLVLQPSNTQDSAFICCCCGDCCEVLTLAKQHPKPASVLVTSFFAKVDEALCSACGDCELRCQMEAVAVQNGHAAVDLDRCIGCGLCVSTCPEEAVHLHHKDPQDVPAVPATLQDLYIDMLRTRGMINTAGLLKMVIRSKKDRLLASF